MLTASRKNASRTRGRPFGAGNPGRPKGARNKTTLAVEALLDGEAEKLTRKAVRMALGGDSAALRLCMERIAPPRRGRPVAIKLPKIITTADVVAALASVAKAMAAGEISPEEAVQIAGVIELQRAAIATNVIEARISEIENRMGKDDERL